MKVKINKRRAVTFLGLRVASGGGGSTQYQYIKYYKRLTNLLQAKILQLFFCKLIIKGILTNRPVLINKNS
jgi:hypothetical protein